MTKYVVAIIAPSLSMNEEQKELICNLPYGDDIFNEKNGDCFLISDDPDLNLLDVFKRGTSKECAQYLAENISGTIIECFFQIRKDLQ